MGSLVERDLVTHWRAHRPKMVARLERLGILREMAHVLWHLMRQTEKQLLASGMAVTDAAEQAERDWLLQEPEAEELDQPDPLDQIPTSQSPSN